MRYHGVSGGLCALGRAKARPAKVGTGFASGRAPDVKLRYGQGDFMRFVGPAALAAVVVAALSAAPVEAREVVAFRGDVSAGTVVVRTGERRLYYVMGDGRAIRYPVGVGKAGKQWSGTTRIDGKYVKPAWSPPKEVKRDKPSLPDVIPGGSPRNPMGAAAMTLAGGEYAIHGTNVPGSVGGFVSYGCIRMYNQDVVDLYSRVSVGTTVMVVR
jgi:lipoprotein-anchoring transpeptidase ErfK/SrfK